VSRNRSSLGVAVPSRRELKQHGAELVAEGLQPLDEPRHVVSRVLELLHVGDIAAGLGGEDEASRHRLAPAHEGAFARHLVEGVVDLDADEVPGIVGQPIGRR